MSRVLPTDAIPEPVVEVCAQLRDAGHRAWVVGGCIRDLLLGRQVSDWDICTSAKPKQVKKVFRKVVPTGIQHGTVTVLWKREAYEVTTLRGEGAYSDGRRPDEVFFVDDIAEDLARRDFTINAIAYDPLADELVDPFGGATDLDARLIRAVGDPAERFAEDGLRILRGARFTATLGFELEEKTRAAFADALEVYAKVSPERVHQEWMKALRQAERPRRAFEVMQQTGILGTSAPLLDALVGVPVDACPHDAFEVSLRALDESERGGDPAERLAALVHGVGRGVVSSSSSTVDVLQDARHGAGDVGRSAPLAVPSARLSEHARVGADLLEGWLRELRFSNEERKTVTHAVRHHRLPDDSASWSDAEVRRFLIAVGPPKRDVVLRLARNVAIAEERDVSAIDALESRCEAQIAGQVPLSVGDLAVNGRDVQEALGGGGRAIGEILRGVLDEVVEEPSRNDRESLLARVRELAADWKT